VFEELEKGQALKDLILEILRQGPCSISQMGKKLKEYNLDLHRLALAGYLRAMADVGILQEQEIPPAKVYALRPTQSPPTLYDACARRVRELNRSDGEATRLFIQVLWDLFHRPIFKEELRRSGFAPVGGIREVDADERQAARRLVSKTALKLPFNDAAYLPVSGDGPEVTAIRDEARALLASVLRQEFRAASIGPGTRQVSLEERPG
jgi:hypothetical protein